jgi:hypothetical protein
MLTIVRNTASADSSLKLMQIINMNRDANACKSPYDRLLFIIAGPDLQQRSTRAIEVHIGQDQMPLQIPALSVCAITRKHNCK